MVQANARDGNGGDVLRSACCVPSTAHATLKHTDVNLCLGKDNQGRNRKQVKLGDVIGTLAKGSSLSVDALPCYLSS